MRSSTRGTFSGAALLLMAFGVKWSLQAQPQTAAHLSPAVARPAPGVASPARDGRSAAAAPATPATPQLRRRMWRSSTSIASPATTPTTRRATSSSIRSRRSTSRSIPTCGRRSFASFARVRCRRSERSGRTTRPTTRWSHRSRRRSTARRTAHPNPGRTGDAPPPHAHRIPATPSAICSRSTSTPRRCCRPTNPATASTT